MTSAEMAMWFFGSVMATAVAFALWYMALDNDRVAKNLLVVAILALILFAWAQRHAEKECGLKHAAEHRAVQEQVESVREF